MTTRHAVHGGEDLCSNACPDGRLHRPKPLSKQLPGSCSRRLIHAAQRSLRGCTNQSINHALIAPHLQLLRPGLILLRPPKKIKPAAPADGASQYGVWTAPDGRCPPLDRASTGLLPALMQGPPAPAMHASSGATAWHARPRQTTPCPTHPCAGSRVSKFALVPYTEGHFREVSGRGRAPRLNVGSRHGPRPWAARGV